MSISRHLKFTFNGVLSFNSDLSSWDVTRVRHMGVSIFKSKLTFPIYLHVLHRLILMTCSLFVISRICLVRHHPSVVMCLLGMLQMLKTCM